MKFHYEYSNRHFVLTPYNTLQELNILLYIQLSESPSIDGVLDILSNNIQSSIKFSELSLQEKKALLMKIRQYSVSEEVTVNAKCPHCNAINNNTINISNVVKNNTKTLVINNEEIQINLCSEPLSEDNLHKFIGWEEHDVDNLSVLEFDEIYNFVQNNITKFDFISTHKCFKCREPITSSFEDENFIINCMSEHDIMSVYQTIHQLVYFGHYSKIDIENMLPFERTIFVGLMTDTIDKINNSK